MFANVRIAVLALPVLLAACAVDDGPDARLHSVADRGGAYGEVRGERFPVPALDTDRIGPEFRRQEVDWSGPEDVGTVVVDPSGHHLFLVENNGRATMYGVAVGRRGFEWAGEAEVGAMREWPDWHPTKEMLERRPDIAEQLVDMPNGPGVAAGPENPLGARGMYLYRDGKDTLFRIHGTPEPYTVGTSVSSGCIRMTNQDAMDLYRKVRIGTHVKVLGDAPPPSTPASLPSREPARSGARTASVPQEYVEQ